MNQSPSGFSKTGEGQEKILLSPVTDFTDINIHEEKLRYKRKEY